MSVTLTKAFQAAPLTARYRIASRAPSQTLWRARLSPRLRTFATSRVSQIAVAEMKESDLSSLRVNRARLMDDIHTTCEWGRGERWGE